MKENMDDLARQKRIENMIRCYSILDSKSNWASELLAEIADELQATVPRR